MLLENTAQSAKQALPFGVAGIGAGAFLGGATAYLATGGKVLPMIGIGSLIGGCIGQVGGMVYVNSKVAGSGILATPVGATLGGATGMGISIFHKNHTDPKTIMKYGLVGLVGGGLLGIGADWLRTN